MRLVIRGLLYDLIEVAKSNWLDRLRFSPSILYAVDSLTLRDTIVLKLAERWSWTRDRVERAVSVRGTALAIFRQKQKRKEWS